MNEICCNYMSHGLSFEYNRLHDCCIVHHGRFGTPLLIEDYQGEIPNYKKIFEHKKELRTNINANVPIKCSGCLMLRDVIETDNEDYFSMIAISHIKLCNAKCIYCEEEFRNRRKYYDVFPVINDIISKGLFRNDGLVIFQGGEPTLMNNFEEIIDLFISQNANIKVNTSGIKFSKGLYNAIEKGNVQVCISLDSGNKETYKKIKYTDKFNIVCENIKKYSEAAEKSEKSEVVIKYLIIPGYNDNLKDIDDWFSTVKSLNIKKIALDIEYKYIARNEQQIPNYIYCLFDYMYNYADKNGIARMNMGFADNIEKWRKKSCSNRLLNDKRRFNKFITVSNKANACKNIIYPKPKNKFID